MRRIMVGVALVGLVPIAAVGIAWGGMPSFEIDPDEGPPGTVITATGEGCGGQARPESSESEGSSNRSTRGRASFMVSLSLTFQGQEIASSTATPEQDGSWTAEITVPGDAQPGQHFVEATCEVEEGNDRPGSPSQAVFFEYEPQPFQVTEEPEEPEEAGPAEEVEEQPTLTG